MSKSLRDRFEYLSRLYSETHSANAEYKTKILAMENEIKELKNDKRWLQQLFQEISATALIKARNQ